MNIKELTVLAKEYIKDNPPDLVLFAKRIQEREDKFEKDRLSSLPDTAYNGRLYR